MSDAAPLSPHADTAARTLRNYVAGAWRAPSAQESLEDRNPATGELLARVPLSGAGDVDEAVAGARAAAGAWARVSPLVRMRAVFRLREVLDEHREELAQLVTRDMGK